MQHLQGAIDVLTNAVKALEARLQPVLLLQSPTDAPGQEEQPSTCTVAQEVNEATNKVMGLRGWVQSLIDRAQV